MEQNSFDAIVVGSGMSGGWAAKELTEKGLKTLVLERGRMVRHPDYPTATKDPWELPYGNRITQETRHRKPVQSRVQDPGVATTILYVRNVDAMLAKLQKAGTPIVTSPAAPVQVAFGATTGRAVVVRDPDGYLIELVQPASFPADAPPSDVIGAGVRMTINNTDQTMRVYRDIMGFQPKIGSFSVNEGYSKLTGVKGETRLTTAPVPGEPRLTFEFVEFRGVDRKPMQTRIQDPGSMKFQFVVRNLETAANKLTSAGGKIQSVGGKQVNLGGAGPHIIVRDPNNFYLILQQQPAPK